MVLPPTTTTEVVYPVVTADVEVVLEYVMPVVGVGAVCNILVDVGYVRENTVCSDSLPVLKQTRLLPLGGQGLMNA